jgi:anti-anti-sigma regulatory factor
MATNFKISVHRKSEKLHLKLSGDFDGSSAHELLNVLKRYCNLTSRVFIHASSVRNIHPFGLNVFHNNLNVLKGKSVEIVFTGQNATQLAPEKPLPFDLIISTIPPVTRPGKTNSDLFTMETG